jgi:rare lipoprotein A
MCWLAISPTAIPQKPWQAACVQRYGRTLSSSGTENRAARGSGLRGVTQQVAAGFIAVVLVGCSSAPTTPGTPGASGAPSRPAKPGGFYQDDGPPEKAPSDPSQIPDAVPRVEPFHRYANRPYTALGRSYTPMTEDRPYRARGVASWYGKQFHGNRTSSGEIYDMYTASAAHPTLPIPSYARVTNTRTGASVIVRINDRGPFKHDRVIDLSYAAAVKIGIAAAGTGEVEVVRFTFAEIRALRGETPSADPAPPPAAAAPALPLPTQPEAGRWSVQIGAFQQEASADALRERIAVQMQQSGNELATQRPPRVERDGSIFRVLVGAVPDRAAAQSLAQQLERVLGRETALLLR